MVNFDELGAISAGSLACEIRYVKIETLRHNQNSATSPPNGSSRTLRLDISKML